MVSVNSKGTQIFWVLIISALCLMSAFVSKPEGLFLSLVAASCLGYLLDLRDVHPKCKASFFSYSTVARFWSVVFIVLGLVFLFVPDLVGLGLMYLASKIGLMSYIDTLPGSLWYGLSLSFMAMIALCAWLSANNPSDKALYRLLLVAKVASTAAFLVLAYREAPVFYLCAGADGFVALTLWWSGRKI